MRICIPIKENNGLDSEVYSHFGSANSFIIYDANSQEYTISDNSDSQHIHGQCQPMKSIQDKNIDVVIVGGIGERAILKLNEMNIKVFKSEIGTAKSNIEFFERSELQELTPEFACTNHNHGSGCE
ncbi:MAG: NifB/NifX family molybdenum-iron cluster-binding protein [Ignavibacteria bacterium]|jgi:predicted Fe-Mo cluster-binding NifX family protein